MVIILELNGINTYHTAKKIKIKMPVPSWKSRSMRDNTGYHTIHGIRPNDFFFFFFLFFFFSKMDLIPRPPHSKPLLLLFPSSSSSFFFFSSSLPLLHITSLQIPPQFHLFGSCVFSSSSYPPLPLFIVSSILFFGFYPHNQRSSISFLQLNRCCSESSARCLLVSTRLLYSILKKRYP